MCSTNTPNALIVSSPNGKMNGKTENCNSTNATEPRIPHNNASVFTSPRDYWTAQLYCICASSTLFPCPNHSTSQTLFGRIYRQLAQLQMVNIAMCWAQKRSAVYRLGPCKWRKKCLAVAEIVKNTCAAVQIQRTRDEKIEKNSQALSHGAMSPHTECESL